MAEEAGGPGEGGPRGNGTVTAALIGGIAVVAAAVLPGMLGPKPAPEPTPQTLVATPTPTPSATPLSDDDRPDAAPTHRIVVANECPKPFWLYLYFHGKDGWTKNGGVRWSYDGPETGSLQRLGSVLRTDRDEIYVYGIYKDGTRAWSGGTLVRIDGADLGFQKANVEEGADGSYTLRLTCSAEMGVATPSG